MATGIHRIVESEYFKKTVFPDIKKRTPIDASKLDAEIKLAYGLPGGEHRPMPNGGFARGLVEELHLHPLVVSPIESWGLFDKPTVMCHNSRGGVEYQEEQVKYFGSSMLDMNNPNSWDTYIARAKACGLKTMPWLHCHNYDDMKKLFQEAKNQGMQTCGLNLEDIVTDGISLPQVAHLIDEYFGTDAILAIPTLGWIQQLDWSALSRHVFLLEFFINDPAPDWVGLDPVDLARQIATNCTRYGVKKFNYVCGIYDASANNPAAKMYSADQYKAILKAAGVKFGGIYLGDNNGSDYAQWA